MLRALVSNWEVKLLSLTIAVVVWFFVVSAERSQLTMTAAVEYVGLGAGKVLVGARRDNVELEVEATRWAAARLTPTSVRLRVDVANLPEGESTVRLSREIVDVPPGVRVTRISPAWLRVAVAAAVTRPVRVVPHVRGTPADGYTMRRMAVDPPTVQLKGPRSTIDVWDTVDTDPVDIAGRQQTVTQTVPLALPDSVFPVTERTVVVTVDIRPEESMRQRKPAESRK
jgi:YbbR domain-containing protein